ncbi:hypothetical protein O6P43_010702 [Quillaja saponaria]|uniref:Transmembrane protein n=1 Tax=Quillaja saponaria TaxID=32244 RepID=A0AAD7Q153_QUISA|nr:hypothetical protein O6P43_010702 [Quillaja saponaria]
MESSNPSTESGTRKEWSFPPPLHKIIFFLVTTLSAFLQLHYSNQTPPVEQSYIMQAFFVALSVYSTSLAIEYELQTHGSSHLDNIKRMTLLLGVLPLVLLMLILCPLYGLLTFASWAIYLVRVTLSLYQEYPKLLTHVSGWMLDVLKRKFTREEKQLPLSL